MPDYKYDKNKNGVMIPETDGKITRPLAADNITAGSNLILKADGEDGGSPISKVEFFGDGKSLGYDTIAPFDWVWFNIPVGKHKINVIATDLMGQYRIFKSDGN